MTGLEQIIVLAWIVLVGLTYIGLRERIERLNIDVAFILEVLAEQQLRADEGAERANAHVPQSNEREVQG